MSADTANTDPTTETEAPAAVPLTDEQKLGHATGEMADLHDKIQAAVVSGDDFTALAVAYAASVTKHRGLFKIANQGAIDEETSQIGQAIMTLVGASKLPALMGEPVTSVYFTITPGEGENGPLIQCGINVRARATSTKASPAPKSGGSGKTAKETFSVDGGPEMTPKEFITDHATDRVRANSLFKTDKWPTKPEFLNESIEALTTAGRSVVRTPVTE